jgi:hypothetical protein
VDSVFYTVSQCGTAVATNVVMVITTPNAGIISGPAQVCVGASVSLSETVSGGVWSTTGGAATIAGNVVSGVSVGAAIVTYQVTNSCGSTKAFDTVLVETLPVPVISLPPTVCVGDSVGISGLPTGGTWSLTSTNAFIAGTTLHGASSGYDSVLYHVSNACGSAEAVSVVRVDTIIVPAVSGANAVCMGSSDTLTGSPSGGTWSVTDTTLLSHTGLSGGYFTPTAPGTDILLYTVSNSCGSFTDSVTLRIYSKAYCDSMNGVAPVVNEGLTGVISIAPNPTNGRLHVVVDDAGQVPLVLRITDVYGRQVWYGAPTSTAGSAVWDVTLGDALPDGHYFVSVSGTGMCIVRSVVVTR